MNADSVGIGGNMSCLGSMTLVNPSDEDETVGLSCSGASELSLGSGSISCSTVNCSTVASLYTSAATFYCGDGDLLDSLFNTSGLYISCNASGEDAEMDIIAINTSGSSSDMLPILNIYTSYTTFQCGLSSPVALISMTTTTVTITGDLKVTGSVNASNISSDYRLKEEIQPISDSFSIDKLNPCSYLLKDDESKKLQTGFIAHELQEIFPHLVNGEKDGEEMQSVNYIGLILVLNY
jgi:hypothetical protein